MAGTHRLEVISGGQIGADQAALLAARQCQIPTGGWAPTGFQTLAGPAPWLQDFGLRPLASTLPLGAQYVIRSQRNVDESDGTLAFRTHFSSGTDKTIGYALTRKWQVVPSWTISTSYKPVCVISDLTSKEQRMAALQLIRSLGRVNVCGHREPNPQEPAWTREVTYYLIDLFAELQLKMNARSAK